MARTAAVGRKGSPRVGRYRGHRLKELRVAHDLSQAQLGALCVPVISGSQINKLEHFQAELTWDYAYRLGAALQLHPAEFFLEPAPPRFPPSLQRIVDIAGGLSEPEQRRFERLAEAFCESDEERKP